jgi:hypothetical protein
MFLAKPLGFLILQILHPFRHTFFEIMHDKIAIAQKTLLPHFGYEVVSRKNICATEFHDFHEA